MTAALIITGWLFSGWLGYLLARYWITSTDDFTRGDRMFFGFFILFGPVTLLTGLIVASLTASESRSNEVLRHRRNR